MKTIQIGWFGQVDRKLVRLYLVDTYHYRITSMDGRRLGKHDRIAIMGVQWDDAGNVSQVGDETNLSDLISENRGSCCK